MHVAGVAHDLRNPFQSRFSLQFQLFCDGCLSAGVLHVHTFTSSRDLTRTSQTTSVHDVGAYLESAYLPDTSPRSFGSPGFPAVGARLPTDRPSAASVHPLPQSASSPCASAAPAAGPPLPDHSRLRSTTSAAP